MKILCGCFFSYSPLTKNIPFSPTPTKSLFFAALKSIHHQKGYCGTTLTLLPPLLCHHSIPNTHTVYHHASAPRHRGDVDWFSEFQWRWKKIGRSDARSTRALMDFLYISAMSLLSVAYLSIVLLFDPRLPTAMISSKRNTNAFMWLDPEDTKTASKQIHGDCLVSKEHWKVRFDVWKMY